MNEDSTCGIVNRILELTLLMLRFDPQNGCS
jgi:hypothetical protein